METQRGKPDHLQTTEGEIPVLKVEWNKPFKLPIASLPRSVSIERVSLGKFPQIKTFNLEITGFKDKTITGTVVVSANSGVIADPYTEVINQDTAYLHKDLIQPAGDVSVEYNIVQDKEGGKPRIETSKIPLMISVTTNPTPVERVVTSRDIPKLTHYLIYQGAVYQGKSGEVHWNITETSYDKWGTKCNRSGFSDISNALMLFPYDKQVFEDLQIVIGDTLSEAK
jgi:hypothetical protein